MYVGFINMCLFICIKKTHHSSSHLHHIAIFFNPGGVAHWLLHPPLEEKIVGSNLCKIIEVFKQCNAALLTYVHPNLICEYGINECFEKMATK
jgi:hypothetical protein